MIVYVYVSTCDHRRISIFVVVRSTTDTQATWEDASAHCPGELLVVECSVMGGSATVWQGTALEQCMHNTEKGIILRHSQFHVPGKNSGSCANEAIVARAIGVVNNSYVSELSVTVTPEMNNKTVECVQSSNISEPAIKTIIITVVSDIMSQNPHPTDAQLSNVSQGELTFSWAPEVKHCINSSSRFYYFIESNGCGSCPHETYMNYVTCNNVSSKSKLCSFTVGANATDGIWKDHVNVTVKGENNKFNNNYCTIIILYNHACTIIYSPRSSRN